MFKMHILNESARDLGVPPAAISQTMSALYGGMQANNKFDTGGQAIPLILSLPSKEVANLRLLPLLKVKSSTTQNLIPLSELVRAKLQAGSQALSHFDGQRSTRVDILLKHGFEIEPAMKYIKKMAAIYLPKNMQLVWSGPSRSFLEANSNMLVMILLALLFIYLVLVMQFKSFVDPFIVLLIIPLAFTGAAIALKLTGGSMNIYTKVSLLTLIGLITKHGILIVDFARYHEQQGKTPVQAAIAAATLRAKPVLMTTLAMILGSLPLVFLSGEGTVALNQMGWTIVGGLLLGSFLSLFAVPVVFVIFRALRLTRLKS
jgi:multidrug efflux pump